MLVNVTSEINSVLSKMHNEDYYNLPPQVANGKESTSLYLTELLGKIRWVFRELFAKLNCKAFVIDWARTFSERIVSLCVLHCSALSTNENGKLRVAADLAQIEYVLTQSLNLIHGHKEDGEVFAKFRSFKFCLHNTENFYLLISASFGHQEILITL
jgi:hypothetical protein